MTTINIESLKLEQIIKKKCTEKKLDRKSYLLYTNSETEFDWIDLYTPQKSILIFFIF